MRKNQRERRRALDVPRPLRKVLLQLSLLLGTLIAAADVVVAWFDSYSTNNTGRYQTFMVHGWILPQQQQQQQQQHRRRHHLSIASRHIQQQRSLHFLLSQQEPSDTFDNNNNEDGSMNNNKSSRDLPPLQSSSDMNTGIDVSPSSESYDPRLYKVRLSRATGIE
jgi:hypothetical protein